MYDDLSYINISKAFYKNACATTVVIPYMVSSYGPNDTQHNDTQHKNTPMEKYWIKFKCAFK